MSSTVLIVEDDPATIELVRLYLERDGHKVIAATDGLEGLRLAREEDPDLVVLDLMLPSLDGMGVCRILRDESNVPIIMLTARAGEEDRLAGLDQGADDYITKPFSPRELAARVRAVLRRVARDAMEEGPAELAWGAIRVDLRHRTVYVENAQVELTPTEFRMLTLLMREPGRTFSRDQIIDRVFGYDFDGFDRTVDVHVSNLRRKLGKTRTDLAILRLSTVWDTGSTMPSWFYSIRFRLITGFVLVLTLALVSVSLYVGVAAQEETERFQGDFDRIQADRLERLVSQFYSSRRNLSGLQTVIEQAGSLYGWRIQFRDMEGQLVADSHERFAPPPTVVGA